MAATKISALTDGVTKIGTDRIPVARSPFGAGDNRYLAASLFESTGVAASAVTAHEGAANPHPGYLTPAEGDAAYEALGAVAAYAQPLDSDLTAIAALTTTAYGRALLELANAAALRTAGGLVIGTNVQAWTANLDEYAAVNPTAAGLALLDDADAAAQRATLEADMLSSLFAAEISVTGTVTATISRMHVCSGTTADYTLTMPSAVSQDGKFIGVRMVAGLTKLVTLSAADGAARVMWAGETAILMSDGAIWVKIAGKTRPMVCSMLRNTTTVVSTDTVTELALNETIMDNVGSQADTTNTRINFKRSAQYEVKMKTNIASGAQALQLQARCHKNGSFLWLTPGNAASSSGAVNGSSAKDFVAGDYVELFCYQGAGADRTFFGNTGDDASSMTIIEIPQW